MSSVKAEAEKAKAPLAAEKHAVVLPNFALRDYASFFAAGESPDARTARLTTLTLSVKVHYVQL
jgi:hypothetical protein